MRCWLVCLQCQAMELLTERTKFDGGCLHCGGGPRVAQGDDGTPMVVLSGMEDTTSWEPTGGTFLLGERVKRRGG